MTKQLLFTRNPFSCKKADAFIQKYNLSSIYRDSYENILENQEMLVSISRPVLRVLLYDDVNSQLEFEIKKFFYGDKYEQFKDTK